MTQNPRAAWGPVSSLLSSSRYAVNYTGTLVKALRTVLDEELWREFVFEGTGEIKSFGTFAEFLDWGSTTPAELLEVLRVRGDHELADKVEQLLHGSFQVVPVVQTLDLGECEAIIERGLHTFVEVGNALAAIRDGRLYRATHGTFEAYCRERWNLSRPRAYQMMEAAGTAEAMSTVVDIPAITSERQARAITPTLKEHGPDFAAEVLREAAASESGVTAKGIREATRRLHFNRLSPDMPSGELQAAVEEMKRYRPLTDWLTQVYGGAIGVEDALKWPPPTGLTFLPHHITQLTESASMMRAAAAKCDDIIRAAEGMPGKPTNLVPIGTRLPTRNAVR